MQLSEFFDVYNLVHCAAYLSFEEVGYWPDSFINTWPVNCSTKMVASCSQHSIIRCMLADAWLQQMRD